MIWGLKILQINALSVYDWMRALRRQFSEEMCDGCREWWKLGKWDGCHVVAHAIYSDPSCVYSCEYVCIAVRRWITLEGASSRWARGTHYPCVGGISIFRGRPLHPSIVVPVNSHPSPHPSLAFAFTLAILWSSSPTSHLLPLSYSSNVTIYRRTTSISGRHVSKRIMQPPASSTAPPGNWVGFLRRAHAREIAKTFYENL